MWLYKMSSIVFFALMVIVHGGRQMCGENCKIPFPVNLASPPAQYCKCFEKYAEWLERRSKKPFYENEVLFYQSTNNTYGKRHHQKKLSLDWYYQQNQKTNNHKINPKFKRTSNYNESKTFHVETSKIPIYLDINVQRSESNEMQITELTEYNLKDCFDLQLIINYRNNDRKNDANIMISKRNRIYNTLTDPELLIEVGRKCNEADNVIRKSIEEVKNELVFRKKKVNDYYFTHQDDVPSNSQFKSTTENYKFKSSARSQKNLTSQNNLVKYKHVHNTNIFNGIPIFNIQNHELNIEITTESRNITFEKAPVNNTNINEVYFENTTNQIRNNINAPLFEQEIKEDIENVTKNINNFEELPLLEYSEVDIKGNLSPVNNILTSITPTALMFPTDINTLTSSINNDNLQTTTISYEQENPTFKTKSNDLFSTEIIKSINRKAETDLTDRVDPTDATTSIGKFTSNSLKLDSEALTEFNNAVDNLDINIIYSNVTNNRTEYYEGDYEIPIIATTELFNNTIVSDVKENERIPNLNYDFPIKNVSLYHNTSSQHNLAASKCNKNESNFSECSALNHDIEKSTNNTSIEITGKLFFKHGNELMPASFFQTPDGQVNVALDLLYLCKSEKQNESKLMKAICKCFNNR